jgi:hypothetical protein
MLRGNAAAFIKVARENKCTEALQLFSRATFDSRTNYDWAWRLRFKFWNFLMGPRSTSVENDYARGDAGKKLSTANNVQLSDFL